MALDAGAIQRGLEALVARRGWPGTIAGLTRLTGGASQQIWAFDRVAERGAEPLILRLAGPMNSADASALALRDEARLLETVRAYDVPVPAVRAVLDPGDGIGDGYVMQRLEGETLPQRILRDDAYADARAGLAYQCGQTLARIHAVPPARVTYLRAMTAAEALQHHYREYRGYGEPRPVFELAFRWLREHLPDPARPTLVHGDFRNGNLMIDRRGLVAALDWELAHIGDPATDLGWLCVDSWRFGESDRPVGGFGRREALFAGYEAVTRTTVDPARVEFWEIFGCLKWGIICQKMAQSFVAGVDRTLERGAIGRRASETEIDLLRRLAPKSASAPAL